MAIENLLKRRVFFAGGSLPNCSHAEVASSLFAVLTILPRFATDDCCSSIFCVAGITMTVTGVLLAEVAKIAKEMTGAQCGYDRERDD
jgi:hypothetical protein